jgi:flagellar hook-associated protein 3 FlgL
MSSITSTFSLASILNQSVFTAQAQLAIDEQEVSTGVDANVGLTLGAQTGQDVQLRSQQSLLQTITSSNSTVSTTLNSTQNILTNVQSTAQSFLQTLIQSSTSNSTAQELQQTAQANLQSLIGQLNTNVEGQFIFGGINSSVQPITDGTSSVTSSFNTFLASLTPPATASTITPAQMQTFLTTNLAPQFTGASWSGSAGPPPVAGNWSAASDTPIASQISPTQTVVTSVSANQTAFQQLTQAYSMVADLGTANLSSPTFQTVVNSAESLVQNAIGGLTNIQDGLGTAQSAITTADNFMSTQMSTLSTQVGNLENVNTFAVQTQVTNLQTQIETAFELTSQLSQISLVKFL